MNHELDSYLKILVKPQLCEYCGKELEANKHHPVQRFCSRKCYMEQYRKDHQQQIRQNYIKWYWHNVERTHELDRKSYRNRRKSLMKYLGGVKCLECDCKSYKLLEFHHINSEDGKEDRKRFNYHPKTMVRYYRNHLEEAKQKLQVLCITCHSKIRRKYG